MVVEEAKGMLLATSGDGTLGVYDLRKHRLAARSEEDEEELLSSVIIKNGGCVVTGTQGGPLLIWDWGKWTWGEKDVHGGPEKFTGHPESVDALLSLDNDTVVTASSDGIIRLVTIRPNKLVGVVGEHGEDPVERLAFSRDKLLLASSSHDDAVRLWDMGYLFEDEGEAEGEEEGVGMGEGEKSRFTTLPELSLPQLNRGRSEDFEEEDEDEDEDGGEEEEEEGEAGGGGGMEEEEETTAKVKGKKKKGKNSLEASRRSGKGGGGKKGGGGMGGFFKDL